MKKIAFVHRSKVNNDSHPKWPHRETYNNTLLLLLCSLDLVHTTREEFENGGFTRKTHQLFPSTPRRRNLKRRNTGHFACVFAENTVREVTWLWPYRYRNAPFLQSSANKCCRCSCSVHKKTKSWCSQVPPVWRAFSKSFAFRDGLVGKLKLVCVNGIKTVGKHVGKLFLCHPHTPTWVCQHEFANFSLPCEGRFRGSSLLKSF